MLKCTLMLTLTLPLSLAGLIATDAGDDLSNGPSSLEFLAFNATAPHAWRTDATNFCCVAWGVGCPATSHGD